MSDIQTFHVGLNDVYDFAYNIAQDFERIVLYYDIELLKPAIDKVINVLEILESSIQRIELLETELRTLKSTNLRLYSEKITSDQEKCKLRQIYEESEESWLEEVINLKSQLSSLKSENDVLKSHLAKRKDNNSKSDDDKSVEAIQEQPEVIPKLKHIIQEKEKQLQDNASTISALNSRIQELLKMNERLHLKNQAARKDISKLIVEKNDAKNELKLHKKENLLLSETIQELLQSSSSIQESDERSLPSKSATHLFKEALTDELSCHQHQESTLQDKVKKLQVELENLRDRAKSKQHEANVSKIEKSNVPLSKIHQLFHLFLGVTTITEFYWF